MRYLFVLLLVLISSFVICQNRYHVDKTTFALLDSIVYLRYDMKPVNGVLFCDYGDMGNYVNGKENGLQRRWHEAGGIYEEYKIYDGNLDGSFKVWHENGRLISEDNYKDGNLNGLSRLWWVNGQLREEGNYINDKREGLWRGWGRDGSLFEEEN